MYLAFYVILKKDSKELFSYSICCDNYIKLCREMFDYEKELKNDEKVLHFSYHVTSVSSSGTSVVSLANSQFLTSSQDDLNLRRLCLLISLFEDDNIPVIYKNSIKELL